MSANLSPNLSPTPLALSLSLELDRARLPRGGEGFARLLVSVPQIAPGADAAARRGLALAVALDTSGSMAEAAGAPDGSPMNFSVPRLGILTSTHSGGANTKIERCKAAIWEAVGLLGDDDMASLTAFSSMAMTLFPMSPMTAENKAKFKAALDKLAASGGTALHEGWQEAGREAAKGIDRKLLCRVALLTDGEASTGERNPEVLARHAGKLAALGVSTSCFGVGARFNEDLMVAMADAGDGNFRYIPDAMLASAAAVDEVNGLGATAGRKAKLRLFAEEGIESIEILNPFDDAGQGWSKLPTLLAGRPIEAVAKIKLSELGALATLRAEVSWENRDGIVQTAQSSIGAELATAEESLASAQNVEVAGAAAALTAALAKTQAATLMSAGDFAGASHCIEGARSMLSATAAYSGSGAEMASLNSLTATMASGDWGLARKTAVFQSYSRSKNQTVATPAADEPAKAAGHDAAKAP